MATTPEEFFVEGLMETPPASPSIFLDLPLLPDDGNQGPLSHDNLLLPYISRLLMEEDIDDKLFCQYSYPALLQAQQPFAQILSSPFFSKDGDNTFNRDIIEGSKSSLQGHSGDQCTLHSAFSKGMDAVGQFSKGLEEAHRFLPGDNNFEKGEQVIQMFGETSNCRGLKKRYNRDKHIEEVEAGRTRKSMIVSEELEEICIHDMFDEMMLHGDEICTRDMEHLHIAMVNENKNKTKGSSKAARYVVDLHTLLFSCAHAVAMNNHMVAGDLLKQIKQHASATGDATQRLAQCFVRGLEARLMGTGMHLWKLLMAERPIVMDFLKAYSLFMAACSFNKVALIFSMMTIVDAMMGKPRLHIVDYGMHYGFQWAGLIRWLANRDGGPPEVKITAINHSQPRIYPAQQIEEQGRRLRKCASEFGLPFKFYVITKRWEEVCIEDLNKDTDEMLVINDLCNFSSLPDDSVFFNSPSPRDTVLNNIRRMRPYVFIQSVVNCSYGTSFLSRFREVLFYYMSFFDMLDATMPRESESRLVLEQGLLGRCVLNAIACEGVDLVDHPEKYRQWQVRNQRAGLRQLPLKPNTVKVLEDTVKKQHHKDFFLSEDGHWLLQGWMGRILFAHSTWVAEDSISE